MNHLLLEDLQYGERLATEHQRMNLTDVGRDRLEALSRRIVGYMRVLPMNERHNFAMYIKQNYPDLYRILYASNINREFTLPVRSKTKSRKPSAGFKKSTRKRKTKGGK